LNHRPCTRDDHDAQEPSAALRRPVGAGADTLAAQRLRQKQHALKTGQPSPAAVFPSADGTMLDEANVRYMFYRILDKAQLRRVRFMMSATRSRRC
jgi:hypothetical protein